MDYWKLAEEMSERGMGQHYTCQAIQAEIRTIYNRSQRAEDRGGMTGRQVQNVLKSIRRVAEAYEGLDKFHRLQAIGLDEMDMLEAMFIGWSTLAKRTGFPHFNARIIRRCGEAIR